MRLIKARVQKYRSIKDTGWFDVEHLKTIMVGPNEAGKSAILQALQQIKPPEGIKGFKALRDYPRSEYNDITKSIVKESDVTIVTAKFSLDEADLDELPTGYSGCTYTCGRKLNNKLWHRLDGGPSIPTFGEISKDLTRLCNHIDKQSGATQESGDSSSKPSETLKAITSSWSDETSISSENATKLKIWLEGILEHIDESNETEESRYDRLLETTKAANRRDSALDTLFKRIPVFVLFSNYFRVKPLIHLEHLADRIDQQLLDDDQYDFGNQCLLKLLGFTARELSQLGHAANPAPGNENSLEQYRDQLDERSYKLNAASVQLTKEIQSVWQPDPDRVEASKLKLVADGQYLKAVVEDELGVEIELDQRSEGFQWLVSFFVVFFAEAEGQHSNAILLLDEPGLSLHGLKQRDFRKTISRLAEKNQTIYSTHSPFLVGPDELDMVRVVEMTDRSIGTVVHTKVSADDPAALLPLQEALGYDLAQSLFGQQRNLVLEGITDYWYIESVTQLLREGNEEKLNEKIALVFANTAGKVVYYATILHGQKLKVAALLDSDAAGDNAASQEVLIHTLGNKHILRTKDYCSSDINKSEIEDLLRDTLVEVAKTELGWDIFDIATKQPNRQIISIFESEIKGFSKYKLAKSFVKWTREHNASDLQADEIQQWNNLIVAINKALK
ncbi:MAG: ATP-binding protein [Candidatus Thiodiazotropha endolucinida]|nr:ATP-binding protein [Candidatus Thiodiazotropha taylori]MCW4262287.1 ATP-binding protein [Candidatus Thiodiazotropha endolucinida]